MKKQLLIIGLLLMAQFTFAQSLPEKFTNGLERAKMVFTSPEGYTETELIDNPHMLYEYALKHNDDKFEVRYAIRPSVILPENNDENAKDQEEKENNVSSEIDGRIMTVTVGYNVFGEKFDMTPFDPNAVKAEFNADDGYTSRMIEPRKEFAGEYKYCVMVSIYKKGSGTAFYYYMFDDQNVFMKHAMPIFYGLKFE